MDASEKEKIRLRRRRIISFIIIVILIHVILNLIKIDITREELVNESVPYIDYEEYETREPEITELCFEREFEWAYNWTGWNNDREGYVSPIFELTNLENESGEFTVEFAFFDNSIYPYDAYHGKPYETVEDRLPWEAAAMHSYPMKSRVNSGQRVVFTSYTEKKHPDSSYWAYADVEAPIHRVCNYTTEYINVTKNISVIKYREEKVSKEVTRSMALWQLLVEVFIKKR